jgi:hypothetical protein
VGSLSRLPHHRVMTSGESIVITAPPSPASSRRCHAGPPTERAFAELVRLSKTGIAKEMREEHRRQVMGDDEAASFAFF